MTNEFNSTDLLFGFSQLFVILMLFKFFWQTREERIALVLTAVVGLFNSVPILLAQAGFFDSTTIKSWGFKEVGTMFRPAFLYFVLSNFFRLFREQISRRGSGNFLHRGKLGVADFLWVQGLCSLAMISFIDALSAFALGVRWGWASLPFEVWTFLLTKHEAIVMGNAFVLVWILYDTKRLPVKFWVALSLSITLSLAIETIQFSSFVFYSFRHSEYLEWWWIGAISILWQGVGLFIFKRQTAEPVQK